MKLSVFYNHILQAAEQSGKSLEEVVKMVAEQGITGVDTHVELIDRDDEMVSRLAKYGIGINCPYEFFNWNSVEYGDTTRLYHLIDSAAKYGADKVLVIPGFLEEEESREFNEMLDMVEVSDAGYNDPRFVKFMSESPDMIRVADMLGRAVAYGKERGVTVMIEPFDNPISPVARTLPIMWFLRHVEGLGFAFDTGNFASADENALTAWELLGDYTYHVHLKDRGEEEGYEDAKYCRGLATVSVGSGYIPIADIVKLVRATGYDGYFAIEHFRHPEQVRGIGESAEYLLGL
ncbi:MAG: sugar phosphate isomerase/epimerase [Ruminococcaceae bacterium]|nr:sugar phosphate isomerase/epimerase [Oscillospiraceae bacterium]